MPRIPRIAAIVALCLGLGLSGCATVNTHQSDAAAQDSWSLDSHGTMPFLDLEVEQRDVPRVEHTPTANKANADLPF